MKQLVAVIGFFVILLMPSYANAQISDRISLLDNFGVYDKGDQLFIFGSLANVFPDSFLILQIVNPNDDLCQIQQLTPLSNGLFVTKGIPLKGKLCGISGEYEIKIFYGDYSTESTFTVSSTTFEEPSGATYFDQATKLVSEKIKSLEQKTNANLEQFSLQLETLSTNPSDNTIEELELLYVDLWNTYFIQDELFEIDPSFRPVVTAALDSMLHLIDNGKVSFDIAKTIDSEIFSSVFYYEIGDTNTAIDRINDVFVSIKNVDPIKVEARQTLSFQELEDSLLSLMTKDNSLMNRAIKEEIAFIFARGTGPIYSTELNDLVDLLSKSRYLDVISRKQIGLYKIVQIEWDSTKSSLLNKNTIEKFLEPKEKVSKLHQAALILRELDNVDRFISDDREGNSELANIISSEWNNLETQLELATSVDDILTAENDIKNMKMVIDASSRISKAVEISQTTNIGSDLTDGWESLLVQVERAQSVGEILALVSEFDNSINELREKRSPISILKFEYETMKNKAEIQADYNNLFMINNALKILDTAEKMQNGNPTVSKIDRIEVLLTWASEKAPEIKDDLSSYSKDAYKVRASDILQRAKSIENLAELGLSKNRFLPNYIEFTDSMMERVNEARNLVINNDLDAADELVRDLFSEWRQVSEAYADDPFGSESGYSKDELKRIEYRKHLEQISETVSKFYNAGFAQHSDKYVKMTDEASELIDYGNFIDAESKLAEIRTYLNEYLPLNNADIIFDIEYDQEKDIWIMEGAVNKPDGLRKKDMRQDLYVTVYDGAGNIHSTLEFTDTRNGDFFTQWRAPIEPGLYVVMLQYMNSKATQIVNVADKSERSYDSEELDTLELAREFEELKSFIEQFGGRNYDDSRFEPILNEIKIGLVNRDSEQVDAKLDELKRLIERYLPMRSRSAVIEAQFDNDKLILSGAVQKTLSFSEDLFIDIFDQQGNLVNEVALKDGASGHFSKVISQPFSPGVYVAQLEYHDLTVTDFFSVN